ncbi:ATP-binding protein [uncultured Meiothermus sp.]|jgi:signal transduction histidine kinase|uniref:sensor histidine kinase n=1 Tax=uncultured Meiothermus sp. TaxID=157471 RepID=UPI00262377EE|nr:ATP-binding protein [uncultured Meiothermus sp.]
MSFWNRLEVRMTLLMILVVVCTNLVMVALTAYQRERVFRELPADVRDFLRRSESRLPPLGFPPELRELLLLGKEIRVRIEASTSPDNPNPIFLVSPLDNPSAVPVRIQPILRSRRPGLEAQLQQNLLIASLMATGLGALVALLFARRIARPIEAVSSAANRLAQGDLTIRIADSGGQDETARLARNFNHMARSLEKLETERRAMIADIAHELRTPLTVMQGRLEAIQDGVMPLEMGEIDRLHNQTGLLARLVEDLRTLSLADAGRLTLELRRLDLVELVRNVATAFGASLEAKKIKLELNLPTRPRQIRADADRMTQIAGNLLANALAHTPEGGVIAIAVFADDKTTTLRVSDTGPGIPPEALSKVFDRFYRSEASRSRATGGSGLGLSIVKALVELHGGTVAARNQPEGGAVFEVRLPLDQAGG